MTKDVTAGLRFNAFVVIILELVIVSMVWLNQEKLPLFVNKYSELYTSVPNDREEMQGLLDEVIES